MKLKRFEKRPLPELDFNISGNLIISEMSLEPVRSSISSTAPATPPSLTSRPTAPQLSQVQNLSPHRGLTVPADHTRNGSVPTLGRSSGVKLITTKLNSAASTNHLITSTASPSPLLPSFVPGKTDMLAKWSSNSLLKACII